VYVPLKEEARETAVKMVCWDIPAKVAAAFPVGTCDGTDGSMSRLPTMAMDGRTTVFAAKAHRARLEYDEERTRLLVPTTSDKSLTVL